MPILAGDKTTFTGVNSTGCATAHVICYIVLAVRQNCCTATNEHVEHSPGEVTEKLLLETVEVLLGIEILMLMGDSDVQAILWLEEVPVFMLW